MWFLYIKKCKKGEIRWYFLIKKNKNSNLHSNQIIDINGKEWV